MLKFQDTRIQSTSFAARTEAIDTLVLHYTELDLEASLRILRYGEVSVHYVLAEDGTVYRLLQEDEIGYHAGLSMWRGQPYVNGRSIGIEIVNLNGNKYPYPPQQIQALIELCRHILAANPGIIAGNIVGHSDIAPKRKIDPGRKFPWQTLAEAGIGLWPTGATPEPIESINQVQGFLNRCGYPSPHAYGKKAGRWVFITEPVPPPEVTDLVQVTTSDILRAFQWRFQAHTPSGIANDETIGLLKKLALLGGY